MFTFDYSYWSHDGYNVEEDGYLLPANNEYADQVNIIFVEILLLWARILMRVDKKKFV